MTQAPVAPQLDVSVVLPFRNAASTISEQLEALASQDFSGRWEVVAVDNCSEDESRQFVESFARPARASRRRCSGEARRGYASNVGARHASAEKLLFVDADDVVAPGYLSAMAAALDRPRVRHGGVRPGDAEPGLGS